MSRWPDPRTLATALVCALGAVVAPVTATEPAAKLALVSTEVTPRAAPPDTLCHLAVRLRNDGADTASSLVFRVELEGRELAVYRNQVFLDPVAPGEEREVPLWSFWTNETGRPLPASGRIAVAVTLVSARWVKPERDADGVTVWRDRGAVEGLPQTAGATIEITK